MQNILWNRSCMYEYWNATPKNSLASLCLNEHQSWVFSSLFFELNRPAICKSYTMENQSMKIVLTSTKKGKKDTFGIEMNGRTFLEMTSAYSHHFCGYNWIWKTVEKVHNDGPVQKVRHHFLRGRVQKIEEDVMEDMYKKELTWGKGCLKLQKQGLMHFMDSHMGWNSIWRSIFNVAHCSKIDSYQQ